MPVRDTDPYPVYRKEFLLKLYGAEQIYYNKGNVNIHTAKVGGFQWSLAKLPLFAGAGLRSLYPVKSEDLSDYLLSFQKPFLQNA